MSELDKTLYDGKEKVHDAFLRDGKYYTKSDRYIAEKYITSVKKFNYICTMTLNKNKLKRDFEDACNAYLKAFCEKHGYDYEDAHDSWAAGDVGGIVICGDQFVSLATIRTDIDMDAPEEEFLKWYDYTSEVTAYDLPSMNFQNWLKRAPRIPQESIDNIKTRKQELDDLIKEAEDLYRGFD